jgi:hypothetical protein
MTPQRTMSRPGACLPRTATTLPRRWLACAVNDCAPAMPGRASTPTASTNVVKRRMNFNPFTRSAPHRATPGLRRDAKMEGHGGFPQRDAQGGESVFPSNTTPRRQSCGIRLICDQHHNTGCSSWRSSPCSSLVSSARVVLIEDATVARKCTDAATSASSRCHRSSRSEKSPPLPSRRSSGWCS